MCTPYSLRAFQWYQEHGKGCHGLGDLLNAVRDAMVKEISSTRRGKPWFRRSQRGEGCHGLGDLLNAARDAMVEDIST